MNSIAACTKTRYRSATRAEHAIKGGTIKFDPGWGPEIYHCDQCNGYHIRPQFANTPTIDPLLRARMCAEKRCYHTEQRAREMAQRAFEQRGTQLRIYACGLCGGWHLTKQVSKSERS